MFIVYVPARWYHCTVFFELLELQVDILTCRLGELKKRINKNFG